MADRRTAVEVLLRERGAEDIPHPGGTLLAHLTRVSERLRDHGAPEVLTLAGLSHAAYGTDGFAPSLLSLDERHVLCAAAGTDVERLVYLYGACDRGRTWPALPATRTVHDRWTGATEPLPPEQLTWFADLTVVNELDVLERSAQLMDAHGQSMRTLVRSWADLLSPAVRDDANHVLGRAGRI